MQHKILVIGYGNPGRQDDGLGPECVKCLTNFNLGEHIDFDSDYQLTLETAEDIASYNEVIFIDASLTADAPYEFKNIGETSNLTFHTHSVSPESLLNLAKNLYGNSPKASILAIRGYDFNEFGESISEPAKENLNKALVFIKDYLSVN